MSGKWSCPSCTLENEASHRHCQMCGGRRRPPSNSSGLVESWINRRRRKRKRKSPAYLASDFSGVGVLKVRIVMDNAEAADADGASAFWENQPPLEAIFPTGGRSEIESATVMHRHRAPPEQEENPEQGEAVPSNTEVDVPAANAGSDDSDDGHVKDLPNQEEPKTDPLLIMNYPDGANDDLGYPEASKSQENTAISAGDLKTDDDNDDPIDDTTSTMDGQSCAQQLLGQSLDSAVKSIVGSADCRSPTENDLSVHRDDGADQNLDSARAIDDFDSTSMSIKDNAPMSQSLESHQLSHRDEEAVFSQSSRETQSCSPGDSQGAVHFSQLLTQQPAGFMYTQAMSQMDGSVMDENISSTTEALGSRTEKSVLSSSQTETTYVSPADKASRPDSSHGPENSKAGDSLMATASVASDVEELTPPAALEKKLRTAERESMVSELDDKLFEGEEDATKAQEQSIMGCHSMVGFATAGKRTQIEVSEASLRRAVTVLKDPETAPADVKHPPAQFQTAGKKSAINVSAESITRASKLLDDGHDPLRLPHCEQKCSQATASFVTAGSRSNIHITEESMEKASNFLRASDDIISSRPPKHSLPMFQTAGRQKRIAVSEESIARASSLLGEESDPMKERDKGIQAKRPSHGFMFQTAGSGKAVNVTEESMVRATKHGGSENGTIKSRSRRPMSGFHAAGSRTRLEVCDEGLASASLILEGVDATGRALVDKKDSRVVASGFASFQTADLGKKIEVSDESLSKASSFLKCSHHDADEATRPAALFQAARSGTSVNVSEESMKKASLLFSNDSEPGASELTRPSIPGFAAFQTAGSGKKIEVSDESLSKASSLRQDSRGDAINRALSFQAAGHGASATLSEDNMKKASPLLDNASGSAACETSARDGREVLPSGFAAFQSAGSGKKIAVSEESLKKAAQVLDSSETQTQTENHHVGAYRTAGSSQTISFSEEDVGKANLLPVLKSQEDAGKNSPGRQARSVSFAAAPVVTTVPARQDPQSLVQADANKENEPGCSRQGADVAHSQAIESDDDEIEKRGLLFDSQGSIPTTGRKSLLSLDQRAIALAHHGDDPENSSSNFASSSSAETADVLETEQAGISLPSLTPSHDAGPWAAAVTLSAKLRNPYLRESPDDARNPSPVPLNLLHAQGTFRDEPIAPATLGRADKLLAATVEGEDLMHFVVDNEKSPDQQLNENIHPTMNDDPDVCLRHGVNKVVLALDSVDARKLRFDSETGLPSRLFGQAPVPGRRLIGSGSDFRSALVDRGCDETNLGDKWLANHMRWIIWKLASIERRFCTLPRSKCLSFEEVVTQLQKRYAKELVGGVRPAIRKVLNRDVASSNMMILVVSQVFRPSQAQAHECRVELSDGWYSIPALLDLKLSAMVDKGTIAIGTKLLVCNAHLQGADDGIDPLDASYDPSRRDCTIGLQLVANATRLARWDARLGFVRPSRTLRANGGSLLVRSLQDVVPGGGNIPLIDLVVCRSYPRMFYERNGNPNEIDSPVISEAEEYMKRMEFEKRRQMLVEKISDDVEKECEKEIDEMAPAVWKEMQKSASLEDYYEGLSAVDRESVDTWRDKRDMLLQNMVQREVESRLDDDQSLFRECTAFIRVFVKSFPTNDSKGKSRECEGALLTVWSPAEKQLSLLKEGTVIRLQNLSVRSAKFDGLLQLTGGTKTNMDKCPTAPATPGGLKAFGYRPRSFVSMFRVHALSQKIARKLLPSSPAPEVDVVAIVLRVVEDDGSEACPTVFLTDESGLVVRLKPEGTTLREIEGLRSLSRVALHNLERPLVVALRDLRVLQYDSIECCAVAAYVSTSSLATHSAPRTSALQKWAETSHGQGCLRHVAACLDVGIPTLRDSTNKNLTAIGYLADVSIPGDNGQGAGLPAHLWVHVDCGIDKEQIWEFPVYLLKEAASICGTSSDDVSLPSSTRERYEKLKSLSRVFGARGCLLKFHLIQKQEWYQVRSIAAVDIKALATTHVALIQRRQHIQEEERARKRGTKARHVAPIVRLAAQCRYASSSSSE